MRRVTRQPELPLGIVGVIVLMLGYLLADILQWQDLIVVAIVILLIAPSSFAVGYQTGAFDTRYRASRMADKGTVRGSGHASESGPGNTEPPSSIRTDWS